MTTLLPFVDGTAHLSTPGRLRETATRHGHLLLRRLLPAADVTPVRDEAFRQLHALGLLNQATDERVLPGARLEGTGYDDPRWLALQQRMCATSHVRHLAAHPALIDVLHALYGEAPMPHRGTSCRLGMPGARELTPPPHQDHHYVGGSLDVWTAWTPMIPCPLALGPLTVRSPSHAGGYRPHAGRGAGRQQVQVDPNWRRHANALAVGDVVLFHCLTVHGALPNTTGDTVRVSMDFRFQPGSQAIHTLRIDGTDAAT